MLYCSFRSHRIYLFIKITIVFQYITHVHFYKIKKKYVDANLDASDNAISDNESSEMLTSQSQIPE